ncbi:LytTR family DNA-binding domain-containing protein [Lactiplantibacillus sp. WILCCON 0030]|uniref:LytTR family DNA-binding domain-containing protein n=1 Tax=Lactiplantibacillus brownii TaxID=3069269 RepID=A0ABU1A544_9LACO|nr:LytTR family DNA-binding domain-containing protein [Lactiplantibacillus brownii]MDQ7936119.1 LytTR family DNA-binding domain-containing protein [Lactiplantibacillus brownii]
MNYPTNVTRLALRVNINKFSIENNIDFKTNYFKSINSFNSFLNNTELLGIILIFDVQLGSRNGINEATRLREKYGAKIQSVIFVSSYPDFVFSSFQAHPDAYLCKPIEYSNFNKTLLKIMKNVTSGISEQKNILIKDALNGDTKIIPENQIISIQVADSYDRSVNIYTASKIVITHDRLNNLYQKLDRKYFFQLSRSIIINLKWISSVNKNYVKMNGNNECALPIPRFKKKPLLEKLDNLVLVRMNEND